jgi:hypothetical protein
VFPERDPGTDLLTVNEQFRVSIVLSRYEVTTTGSPRWTTRFDRGLEPDLTIAVRMDATNAAPLDCYILPSLDVRAERLRVASENFFGIDAYRCESATTSSGWPNWFPLRRSHEHGADDRNHQDPGHRLDDVGRDTTVVLALLGAIVHGPAPVASPSPPGCERT